MNHKEEAEKIVDGFYKILLEKLLLPSDPEESLLETAILLSKKHLEMLIEANPTIESEPMVVGPMCIEETEMVCNKAHYKEVLKAIKEL